MVSVLVHLEGGPSPLGISTSMSSVAKDGEVKIALYT